ncbi:MAG: type II toxin-antitoxin system RelE/ParE family toxin [Bacteroidetes bacterium]|nr:MAG: type II toxin-antitoxin system RelE/ParE family toxin [Bacteroidota bacterium]
MEIGINYEVLISENAQIRFKEILLYLDINWSESVKNNFVLNFKKIIEILKSNPYLFQEFSKKKKIRKCLITKHNALYYTISNNKVQIITIQDTRQNPKKLKL